jgi:predicted kinase
MAALFLTCGLQGSGKTTAAIVIAGRHGISL